MQVSKPRALVDLTPAISSALLINEVQWFGIIVRPIDYSLKGGVLHIDTGPGLEVVGSHVIEMERYTTTPRSIADRGDSELTNQDALPSNSEGVTQLTLQDSKVQFPDWASNVTSALWIPVRAVGDEISRGMKSNSHQSG